ncbi:Ubiquitin carboxyl-terminal hydrolase 5, partial [Taenia solium]
QPSRLNFSELQPESYDHIPCFNVAIGVPDGFDLLQDKDTVSGKWCLGRFPGGHSVDNPCPSEDCAVTDVSHLEGAGLSARVVSSINSVQRCDSAILVAKRAGVVAAWEAENACPVANFVLGLVQLNNVVTVPPSGLKCHRCELVMNLGMNLADKAISCG